MPNRVILVPRRADNGPRDVLWDYCKPRWANLGYPIYEGDHLDGPFNRGAAVNTAAQMAGDWDTAIVIDSDVLVGEGQVNDALNLAERLQRMVFTFRTYQALNHVGAKRVMEGLTGSWKPFIRVTFHDNRSASFVIPRSVWDKIGGFDERFVGWGWEDLAFAFSASAAAGNYLRITGDLWHLWHPKSPENNRDSKLYIANQYLCHRYIEAQYSWPEIKSLLSEPGGPLL
jgi:GT2 family glycosyltransferase